MVVQWGLGFRFDLIVSYSSAQFNPGVKGIIIAAVLQTAAAWWLGDWPTRKVYKGIINDD